nr:Formate dehydrogenase, nitrate-inducible, major subunit precursor [Klebsiella pneumoniae]
MKRAMMAKSLPGFTIACANCTAPKAGRARNPAEDELALQAAGPSGIGRGGKENNGYALADLYDQNGTLLAKKGQLLNSFALLRDDGSTASSCWIYTGSWTEQGNQMANRDNADPSGRAIRWDGHGVAAQSSGAVQPRFGRYQRQALGCEADADPVERQQVGRE